jgi:hypothetical protein
LMQISSSADEYLPLLKWTNFEFLPVTRVKTLTQYCQFPIECSRFAAFPSEGDWKSLGILYQPNNCHVFAHAAQQSEDESQRGWTRSLESDIYAEIK